MLDSVLRKLSSRLHVTETPENPVPDDKAGPGVALMIVAHTPLASAFKDVARHVFGQDAAIRAIDVLPGACAADSSQTLLDQIKMIDEGAGVLIMTDLPGASPCNICASAAALARQEGVACQVVAGVNAAMILRAVSYRDRDLETLTQQVVQGASRAVMRVD